jgi:hypothetical protein
MISYLIVGKQMATCSTACAMLLEVVENVLMLILLPI